MAQAKPEDTKTQRESFAGPVRVQLRVGSTILSRLYERTPEGRNGVVRLRKPLHESAPSEPKSSSKSEPKSLRVRKPKRKQPDLEPEARKLLSDLEANLVSVGLRRLELRRYEGPNGVTYLAWMYHEPGKVALEGSGRTLSQALASLLNAAIKSK
jgi:hypothetical protein